MKPMVYAAVIQKRKQREKLPKKILSRPLDKLTWELHSAFAQKMSG